MSNFAPFPERSEEDRYIARTLEGEKDAFGALLLKYKDSLYELACRILGNRTHAEDILQDAFIEAYRHLAEFKHRSRFSTWLYSIVLNRIRNHLRHNKIVRWSSLDVQRTDTDYSRPLEMPERGPSLQKIVEQRMELEALQKEVRLLPLPYQSIFILHYFQEMSLEDVAERLNRPLGTIKVYLHRARKLLYKQLARRRTRKWLSQPFPHLVALKAL